MFSPQLWSRGGQAARSAIIQVPQHCQCFYISLQPFLLITETLLAILLVTSFINGSSLICHWPLSPQASPHLAHPLPTVSYDLNEYNNLWWSPTHFLAQTDVDTLGVLRSHGVMFHACSSFVDDTLIVITGLLQFLDCTSPCNIYHCLTW
jgi:hypothetical protein